MRLVVSDANIFIDMEAGGVLDELFRLPFQLCCPDILYFEELEDRHPHLPSLGLQLLELSPASVRSVEVLRAEHGNKPSTNDYFALSLAMQENLPLVTGDLALKQAAQAEGVPVCGTIGLMALMVANQQLTPSHAQAALASMRLQNRRLPWNLAGKAILQAFDDPRLLPQNIAEILSKLDLDLSSV